MRSCPHGIVAGVCNFCLADQLALEGRVLKTIPTAPRALCACTTLDGVTVFCASHAQRYGQKTSLPTPTKED